MLPEYLEQELKQELKGKKYIKIRDLSHFLNLFSFTYDIAKIPKHKNIPN